jgi:hypothetical protein
VLAEQRSSAELCRELLPFLLTWEDAILSGQPNLFQRVELCGPEQSHIAELELVGRQTLELEIANKSLQAAPWDRGHLERYHARSVKSRGLHSLDRFFPDRVAVWAGFARDE